MTDAGPCPACGGEVERTADACPSCTASLAPGDAVTAITLVTRAERLDRRRVERLALTDAFRASYRLERCLGSGGNGMVFRAVQLSMGRPVAVKFMTHVADAALRERFLREGRLLARLKHPRVVGVIELGAAGGHPYLVTELLPGPTLRARLREGGPLAWADALVVARDLAGALAACHEAGIVHRDVKPENVMFGADGRARLLDLGLARLADAGAALTHEGSLVGTPRYMSPEQAGGGEVGPAADLYALGCVTFEMLAGRAPFVHSNIMELIAAHAREPAPRLAELAPAAPAGLVAAVERCLEKEPARRPESAAALAAMLEACGGPARAASRTDPPPPARARGAAAAGLAALGGLLLALVWRPASPAPPARTATAIPASPSPSPSGSNRSARASLPEGCVRRVPALWGHQKGLEALAGSPDDRLIASGSEDGSLAVWDRVERRMLWSVRSGQAVVSLAFTPDGARVLSGHRERARLLSVSEVVCRAWDARRGVELGEPVTLGPLLLKGENLPELVKVESAFGVARGGALERLPGPVVALGAALSPRGDAVAVLEPAAVALWKPGARAPAWRVPRRAVEARVSITFSGDGSRIVVTDGHTGAVLRASDGAVQCALADARAAHLSPDGRLVAVLRASAPLTDFLDVATGAPFAPTINFDGESALPGSGRIVLLGVYDRVGYLALERGRWRHSDDPLAHCAMAVGADARWGILRELDGGARYRVWDRATGVTRELPPIDIGVGEMRVSPYGPEAIALDFRGAPRRAVRIVDAYGARVAHGEASPPEDMLRPTAAGWLRVTGAGAIERVLGGPPARVATLPPALVRKLATSSGTGLGHLGRFDRTGRLLALAGPYGSVDVVDVPSGRVLAIAGEKLVEMDRADWHVENEPPLAFSRDSRHLFCETSSGELHQVDLASGARLRRFRGPAVHATAVVLSADERLLAAGYDDGAIHVWFVPTGRPVATFQSGAGIVRQLGIDAQAGVLLSIGRDRAMLEWALSGAPTPR